MKPRLVIRQKITALVNKYSIYTANETGEAAGMVGLAQQKRIALKEKVLFYADEKRDNLNFTFRAEKVMDIHGRYFVEDANGKLLGMFKKEFGASLLNSTWKILDADGNEKYTVRESNQAVAILRRFIGAIPLLGELAELVMMFVKYHFEIVDAASGQKHGRYQKTTLFRDHYVLEADDELWGAVDWRVIAALSVALDALQSR